MAKKWENLDIGDISTVKTGDIGEAEFTINKYRVEDGEVVEKEGAAPVSEDDVAELEAEISSQIDDAVDEFQRTGQVSGSRRIQMRPPGTTSPGSQQGTPDDTPDDTSDAEPADSGAEPGEGSDGGDTTPDDSVDSPLDAARRVVDQQDITTTDFPTFAKFMRQRGFEDQDDISEAWSALRDEDAIPPGTTSGGTSSSDTSDDTDDGGDSDGVEMDLNGGADVFTIDAVVTKYDTKGASGDRLRSILDVVHAELGPPSIFPPDTSVGTVALSPGSDEVADYDFSDGKAFAAENGIDLQPEVRREGGGWVDIDEASDEELQNAPASTVDVNTSDMEPTTEEQEQQQSRDATGETERVNIDIPGVDTGRDILAARSDGEASGFAVGALMEEIQDEKVLALSPEEELFDDIVRQFSTAPTTPFYLVTVSGGVERRPLKELFEKYA